MKSVFEFDSESFQLILVLPECERLQYYNSLLINWNTENNKYGIELT